MLNFLRALVLALTCGVVLAACSAAGGNGGTVLLDASVLPGADTGANTSHADGAATGPDGGSTGGDTGSPGTDGGVATGDGSVTASDGAGMSGDGSAVGDGSGPIGDGGTGCMAHEICNNGLDDNCNGMVDENCPCLPGQTERCYPGFPNQAGIGVCIWGTQTCTGPGEFGTWSLCTGAGMPMTEDCSRPMDYHCDGIVGEGCGCTPGTSRACYTGPMGTENIGACHDGTQSCGMTAGGSDWGPCSGDVTPTPNVCDGIDRECTGMPMAGCTCIVGTSRSCYDGPSGTLGIGVCHAGVQTCAATTGGTGASAWGTCAGEVTPSADMCDGTDRMCNGMPMAGCACLAGQTRSCYTGPASTRGVGICRDGTQMCVVSGATSVWSSTCAGEILPLPADVCGDGHDDNCDGTVGGGCGGTITCPADQTVPAGNAVTLSTGGAGLHGYVWTITSAPAGGASVAGWTPSPPNAATESFLPYIVGVYTIQVSAMDAGGHTTSCAFNVTALSHGLRVQLTWNGAGDADLHVHDGNGTPWFNFPDDCYYANRSPAWGAVLDFDNTTANGPENTRINSPAIGMTYTVGVENYARAEGRTATVQIFCGTTTGTTPTATFVSTPLAGNSAGDCSGNTFWKVARVMFTSPTACTITPLNQYTTGAGACGSL